MKKTLITIALTTVVVLTLVGVIASQARLGSTYNAISNRLDLSYGGGASPEFYASEAPPAMEAPAAPMPGIGGGDASVMSDAVAQTSAIASNGTRLVIKNADLAIVVKDPNADMARIRKLAEEMGGYVVASNMYQTASGIDNIVTPEVSITIRVPSEKLDEALERIKKGAVDVDYENTTSQDVTSEYVDLQSRLGAKQAAEKKLLEIMDDAVKTEDVLAVYMTLQQIQTEIEVLKGQIKYYEESATLSAISVRLIAERGAQPIDINPWRPSGAANQAIENLTTFAQNFADFLINFTIFVLPALILIAIPLAVVYFGGRAIFRRFRKSKVVVEVKEDEKK